MGRSDEKKDASKKDSKRSSENVGGHVEPATTPWSSERRDWSVRGGKALGKMALSDGCGVEMKNGMNGNEAIQVVVGEDIHCGEPIETKMRGTD